MMENITKVGVEFMKPQSTQSNSLSSLKDFPHKTLRSLCLIFVTGNRLTLGVYE